MARMSAKRSGDTLWFPAELGLRLAELRKKQGLTQQQLAVLMGRGGKGNWNLVSRIEHGRMPTPSLRLVGDYLRACRAGFGAITDILDRYTSQPTALDKAGLVAVREAVKHLPAKVVREVVNYDIQTTTEKKGEPVKVVKPEVRSERGRKLARAAMLRHRLGREVIGMINRRVIKASYVGEIALKGHARRVWGILARTRGRSEERRQRLIAEAEGIFTEKDVPREYVRKVTEMTVEFFGRAQDPNEFDALAGEQASGDEGGTGKAGRMRLSKDEIHAAADAYKTAREAVIDSMWQHLKPLVEQEGVAAQKLGYYLQVVRQCCYIADNFEPGSREAEEQVEKLATDRERVRLGADPELSRRVADFAIRHYSEVRDSLPPNPQARPRYGG